MRNGGKRLLVLAGLLTLAGCGGGDNSGGSGGRQQQQATYKAAPDATYNDSVISGGYRITDLGPGKVAGINNKGQVVGTEPGLPASSLNSTGAFFWQNGVRHYLGVLPSDIDSQASAINDNGQIVGASIQYTYHGGFSGGPASGYYATYSGFVWQNGTLQPYLPAKGRLVPFAINNAGTVLGQHYADTGVTTFFLAQNGAVTDPPVHISNTGVQPLGNGRINNAGNIAGFVGPSTNEFVETKAAIYRNGSVTTLGTLPGATYAYATLINDAGSVAGLSGSSSTGPRTFLWQNGQFTDLSAKLPNTAVYVTALNNKGDIAGYSGSSTSAYGQALLYTGGKWVALDDRIAVSSGWRFQAAFGINNAGQIVGIGVHDGQGRIFLLTPQ